MGSAPKIDDVRLARLFAVEAERFTVTHPRAAALAKRAGASLVGGVPMSWMQRWASPVPPYAVSARDAEITDADGHAYLDFALGDTAAMAGHAPTALTRAITEQLERGATTMLPSEAAIDAADELTRRFGLPLWQLCLTATDANRFVLRIARAITKRPKILVHNWCYHGTVDETFAVAQPGGAAGAAVARPGNTGPQVDPATTTRVVEINDLAATEAALAAGDVAAVLIEPALTNIGIVLPDAGYHAALRALAARYGALLIADETHTISMGPGGATAAWGLEPDLLVIGKAIAGGLPGAAYGMRREVAAQISSVLQRDEIDTGGIGGTVSGSVLSAVAIRTTLREVLTDAAFPEMIAGANRWADGAEEVFARRSVGWSVTRLGARAEYHFTPEAPRNGGEAAAAVHHEMERYLHLHALNRGIIMTPFHNMALFSPATPRSAADLHSEVLDTAIAALIEGGALVV
ncbi:MAG: transaminase [Candidatus Limnocylindrus sp.]